MTYGKLGIECGSGGVVVSSSRVAAEGCRRDYLSSAAAMAQSSCCGKDGSGRYGMEVFVSPLPNLLATYQRLYLFLCQFLQDLYVARMSQSTAKDRTCSYVMSSLCPQLVYIMHAA